MRVWFMMATLTLGLLGWLSHEGRTAQTDNSIQVQQKDGPGPIPTPKAP